MATVYQNNNSVKVELKFASADQKRYSIIDTLLPSKRAHSIEFTTELQICSEPTKHTITLNQLK